MNIKQLISEEQKSYNYVGKLNSLEGLRDPFTDSEPKFKYEITLGLKDVKITVTNPENFGKSASQLSEGGTGIFERTIPNEKIKSIRHNMVCLALLGEFDPDDHITKIAYMNDHTDRLTPDWVEFVQDGRFFGIAEVKTFMNDSKLGDVFASATAKYENEITRRLNAVNQRGFYAVIVVGEKQVMSNLKFDRDLMISVKAHLRLGVALETYIRQKDPTIMMDLQEEAILSRVNQSILRANSKDLPSEYHPNLHKFPLISQKMVDDWKEIQIDEKDTTRFYWEIRKEARAEYESRKETGNYAAKADKIWAEFSEEWQKDPIKRWGQSDLRFDPKAIMPVPFIMPLREPVLSDEFIRPRDEIMSTLVGTEDYLMRMWRDAFLDQMANEESFHPVSFEEELTKAIDVVLQKPGDNSRSATRRNFHRVTIKNSPGEREQLATHGLRGKRYKNSAAVQMKHMISKTPFSPKVKTNDIEDFISKNIFDLLQPAANWCTVGRTAEELIKMGLSASEIEGRQNYAPAFLEQYHRTKLYALLSVFSSLMEEVNYSLNQFCKPDQYVLKKFRWGNMWYLIKPTVADKVIGVSILIDNFDFETMPLPFKQPEIRREKFTIFPFFTLNRHKISHYLYAPYRLLPILMCNFEYFHVNPLDFWANLHNGNFGMEERDALEHFATSVLIYLEDKQQTSADLQMVRYMYMEASTANPLESNTMKIFSKLSGKPRSRLLVWFYKRMYITCRELGIHRPVPIIPDEIDKIDTTSNTTETIKSLEDDYIANKSSEALNSFKNLISWVNGRKLKTYDQCLHLSYFGYLHNKDESEEHQADREIFNKVIQEELLLKKTDSKYWGRETKHLADYKDHEFDPRFCAFAADCGERVLRREHGDDYKMIMEDKIMRNLCSKTAQELATLKSSSCIQPDLTYDPTREHVPRRKAVEGIFSLLKQGMINENIYENLDKMLDFLENGPGIFVSLFRKAQIGGTREIFILEITARLVIHFMESIARMICEMFPMEMLTKGDQKLTKSDAHLNKVFAEKLHGRPYEFTAIDSNDATTWCQRFIMPTFGCFFSRILPEKFVKPVMRVLNLMTEKKIVIPKSLLDEFDKLQQVETYNKNIAALKDQFLGRVLDHDLMEPRKIFMHNYTNMMQGIAHFSSSLIHVLFMSAMGEITQGMLMRYKRFKKLDEDMVLKTTVKVSSDDSSVYDSLLSSKVHSPNSIEFLMMCSLMRQKAYAYCTILLSSAKSTQFNLSNLEEFNSWWLHRNTLHVPKIKQCFSATQTPVVCSFDDRQRLASNGRRQMLETGSSYFTCAVTQLAQAYIHYTCLGLNTLRLSTFYKDLLKIKPHPSFGFFVFEPEWICGLFGHQFARYLACRRTPGFSICERGLMYNEDKKINDEGKPIIKIQLLMGRAAKYRAFLERLQPPFNWREFGNNNVEMLYRRARSPIEAMFWILSNVHKPKVVESFSFNTANKQHAASVFVLSQPCITTRMYFKDKDATKTKQSLIGFLVRFNENGSQEGLSTSDFEILYPNLDTYDAVVIELERFVPTTLTTVLKNRPQKLTIEIIPKTLVISNMSLVNVIRKYWFNMSSGVKGSETERSLALQTYQKYFPWLSEDLNESFKASKFKDQVALRDFIMTLMPSTSTISILGPIRKNLPMMEMIYQSQRKCFISGFQLLGHIKEESKTLHKSALNTLASLLLLRAQGPPQTYMNARGDIYDICQKAGSPLPKSLAGSQAALMSMSKNEAALCLIGEFIRGNQMFDELIAFAKRGIFSSFLLRQKITDSGPKGEGILYIQIDSDPFYIFLYDSNILKIKAMNLESVRRNMTELRTIFRETGLHKFRGSSRYHKADFYLNMDKFMIEGKFKVGSIAINMDSNLKEAASEKVINTEYWEWSIGEKGMPRIIQRIDYNAQKAIGRGIRDAKPMYLEGSNINLYPTEFVPIEGMYFTVLSVKPSAWKFSRTVVSNELITTSPFLNSWFTFKDVDPEIAMSEINDLYLGFTSKVQGIEIIKNWYKDSITLRAQAKLYRPERSITYNATDEIEVTDAMRELSAITTEDFLEYDQNQIDIIIDQMGGLPNSVIDAEDFLDLDMFYSGTDLTHTTEMFNVVTSGLQAYTENLKPIHPFWDSVISELFNEGEDIGELILGEFQYIPKTEFGEAISWIVDNKTRPLRKVSKFKFLGNNLAKDRASRYTPDFTRKKNENNNNNDNSLPELTPLKSEENDDDFDINDFN